MSCGFGGCYDTPCYVCGEPLGERLSTYDETTRTGRGWRHDACPEAKVCPKPCLGRHYYRPCARR